MQKKIFQVLSVIMILGLLAGTLTPVLLSLGSLNTTDAQEEIPTQEVSPQETAD
jgi:hypothetical protein